MGFKCIFVMEMPGELELILERSAALGVRPLLGVRVKLITKGSGHWAGSCGERSAFGLTTAQVVDIVDTLKQHDMLDCLQLLHYHLGSQVPNIRDIRTAVMESTRVYAGLVQEGAKMGYLDLGGGLAVDYDGSHTNLSGGRPRRGGGRALSLSLARSLACSMAILDQQGTRCRPFRRCSRRGC